MVIETNAVMARAMATLAAREVPPSQPSRWDTQEEARFENAREADALGLAEDRADEDRREALKANGERWKLRLRQPVETLSPDEAALQITRKDEAYDLMVANEALANLRARHAREPQPAQPLSLATSGSGVSISGLFERYAAQDGIRSATVTLSEGDALSSSAARIWSHISDLSRIIDKGDTSVGIPPYNGGQFASDGASLLDKIRIPDSVTVGAPLSFIDHHLHAGDSLFGLWVRDAIDKAGKLGGELLWNEALRNAQRSAEAMKTIEALTDVEIAEAHRSAAMYQDVELMTGELDGFVSFMNALDWLNLNPPWDRIKLQQVEWFAARRPEIAAEPRAADRKQRVDEMVALGNSLAADFLIAEQRANDTLRMARYSSGKSSKAPETGKKIPAPSDHYPLLSSGDINL
ncbi:hypothetical protein QH494_07895 [Sphingomonas sp. AR_OL41]|uniref:hypothetical protein n=1 Tax=Sphingomonas sp. AR_OL41 TaxID=3042729 RepID=UPI0024811785|nr:hypothetical protein [Sphingomonas sp. AR_OL41]MDH7972106.1 hypothetical protein [Sphingomonas sp. AR_OL41]